ncbi:MAG: sodium:solute symporter [Ignavibacteria bacterium RBG_16_36_9]|nr:MAG: sodium:solute symporter [Ignavibacteria bacterium RBG_16_36_9]
MEFGWLSVIPPLFAIVLAIKTRQVFLSLFLGIVVGWIIISDGNILIGFELSIQSLVDVLQDAGNTRVVMFCALVGALISLTQANGGVQGFVDFIQKKNIVTSRRHATVFSFFVGCIVFIESSISSLVTGTIFHPIFEKFKISREKLAYICDTTSSPICILIPLNAWGAYVVSLLEKESAYPGLNDPVSLFLSTIPLNFYAILSVLFACFISFSYKDFGAMKKAEIRSLETGKTIADGAVPMISEDVASLKPKKGIKHKSFNMIIPIAVMIIMMPISLLITGNGSLTSGSGSTSVLWSVLAAIIVAGLISLIQRILTIKEVMDYTLKGISGLVPLAILMVLAFSIGETCRTLGTGIYVASLSKDFLNPSVIAPILFVTSCFISFSTGTSWGTFAIMIPIAVPTAIYADASLSLSIAAVLSGSVFGDHCSPISDTTIVSSMASACDHIDHVRTQLPYAVVIAILSASLFWFAGSLS